MQTECASERNRGFDRVTQLLEQEVYWVRMLRGAIDEEAKANWSHLVRGAEASLRSPDSAKGSLAAALLLFLKQEYRESDIDVSLLRQADTYIRSTLRSDGDSALPSLISMLVLGLNGEPWATEIARWKDEESVLGDLASTELGQRTDLAAHSVARLAKRIRADDSFVFIAVDALLQVGLRHPSVWDAVMNKLVGGDSCMRSVILLALVPIKANQEWTRWAVQKVLQDEDESPQIRGSAGKLLKLIDLRLQNEGTVPANCKAEATQSFGEQFEARAKAIAWISAAVLYFIFPLDFDFVPLLGWTDDLLFAWYCSQRSWACLAA